MTIYRATGGGEIGFDTILPFGKHKGKSLNQLQLGERVTYLRWLMHAENAKVWAADLAVPVIKEVLAHTSGTTQLWVNQVVVKFELGQFYQDKLQRAENADAPPEPEQIQLPTDPQAIEDHINKDMHRLLNNIHTTFKELDDEN